MHLEIRFLKLGGNQNYKIYNFGFVCNKFGTCAGNCVIGGNQNYKIDNFGQSRLLHAFYINI